MYIYIYCNPQTDCFVVSQLISVVRHAGCFKLGLKPAQLDIRLSTIPLSHQLPYVSLGIIRHYVVAFTCLYFALLDSRMLNSYEPGTWPNEYSVRQWSGRLGFNPWSSHTKDSKNGT